MASVRTVGTTSSNPSKPKTLIGNGFKPTLILQNEKFAKVWETNNFKQKLGEDLSIVVNLAMRESRQNGIKKRCAALSEDGTSAFAHKCISCHRKWENDGWHLDDDEDFWQ